MRLLWLTMLSACLSVGCSGTQAAIDTQDAATRADPDATSDDTPDAAAARDAASPAEPQSKPEPEPEPEPDRGSNAGPASKPASADDAPSEPPAPIRTIDCTRAGLTELVHRYFDALAAHDPKRLPTTPEVKFTENAQRLPLGEGLWKTAGTLMFERSALDTEQCQTFTEAVLEHPMPLANQPKGPVIAGVRLKLENQRVSEIETFAIFDTGVAFSATGLLDSASENWKEPLPSEQRVPRDQLVAVATAYFEHRGNATAHVPFGTPCFRRDNGLAAASCENSGPETLNPLPVTHRRFGVVDVEAGIVVGTGLYIVAIPGFAMLKVPDGEIRMIDTGTAYFGQGATSSGWD